MKKIPLLFAVIDTVNTGLNNKSKPKSSPLSDGTVAVLGQKKKGVKNLKQFHLKCKTEMFSELLNFSTSDNHRNRTGRKTSISSFIRVSYFVLS